jgi:hypothetical protein
MKRMIKFIWGWSLMGEALTWEFLLNRIENRKIQDFMLVRSFRTAIAGANLLADNMFKVN